MGSQIEVEGYEAEVLQGLTPFIKHNLKYLVGDRRRWWASQFFDFMEKPDDECFGESFTDYTNGSTQIALTETNNQFFQYQFNFNSTDGNVTPQLYNVTVQFTEAAAGDTNFPPNITFISLNSSEQIVEGGLKVLNFSFIANDTNGAIGLDNNSIIANITFSGEATRNATCSVSSTQDGDRFPLSQHQTLTNSDIGN